MKKTKTKTGRGKQLATLFYNLFIAECGPFGGEDPYLDENSLGLHSQSGTTWYTFNDDGSVDIDWDNAAKRELECEGFDDPYEQIQTHYDTVGELMNSDDGWWVDIEYELNTTISRLLGRILS